MTRTTAPPHPPRERTQHRTLTVLVASQILSGAGLAAGISVGALLAKQMLGSTDLSGLPIALLTAGSALAAVAVGRLSHTRGRRVGLTAGYLTGAVGGAGIVTAAALDSPPLLFVALLVYGAGSATNLQARYAGADLASPAHRGRAVSTVLVATTLGGVLGPNLGTPTGDLAGALGLPRLTGPFLLATAAYAAAALVLALRLRPDPLLLARALDAERPHQAEKVARGGTGRAVVWGALVMVLTQLVMVAIMTMTPVHMHDHGHTTTASGLVIAVHVGAMYLPSPVTGWLVDRYGRLPLAAAAGVVLPLAGLLAAVAPDGSVALLAVALALLGLGWNLGLVTGTAIVTDSVPLATRARTQGLVDVSVAVAGAAGGLLSGFVVAGASYPLLALAGGVVALGILPAVAASAGRR